MEIYVKLGRCILYLLLPAFFLFCSNIAIAGIFKDRFGYPSYGCWYSASFDRVITSDGFLNRSKADRFGCPNYNSAVAFIQSYSSKLGKTVGIYPLTTNGPFSAILRVSPGNLLNPVPSYLAYVPSDGVSASYYYFRHNGLAYPSPQFVSWSNLSLTLNPQWNPYLLYGITEYYASLSYTFEGRSFTAQTYPGVIYGNPDVPRQVIGGGILGYTTYEQKYYNQYGQYVYSRTLRDEEIGVIAVYFLSRGGVASKFGYSFGNFAIECIDECKYDLSAKKSAIQQEGSALFSGLTNAQAALPCYPLLCLSGMESQLQPISNAFLLIGSLGAGFIVFRKKPKKGRDRHV